MEPGIHQHPPFLSDTLAGMDSGARACSDFRVGRFVHFGNRLLLHSENGRLAIFCGEPGLDMLGAVDLRRAGALGYQSLSMAVAAAPSALRRPGNVPCPEFFL